MAQSKFTLYKYVGMLRVEVPELRIISDELWEMVQAVNRRGRDKYYATRQGGMNRTDHSRKYLLSGVMVCGICGGPYTVIDGKAPNVRYGCPNHRFRNTCTTKTTILLVLTPKQTADGTVLDVTGDMEMFQQQEDVMLNTSMEGIAQHYSLPQMTISLVLDPSLPLAA